MRYVTKDNEERQAVVTLHQDGDEVRIDIGEWCVGRICKDGTFRLAACIPIDNDAGLKVDNKGKIIIKES